MTEVRTTLQPRQSFPSAASSRLHTATAKTTGETLKPALKPDLVVGNLNAYTEISRSGMDETAGNDRNRSLSQFGANSHDSAECAPESLHSRR